MNKTMFFGVLIQLFNSKALIQKASKIIWSSEHEIVPVRM